MVMVEKGWQTKLNAVLAEQGRKKSWLAEQLHVDRSTVTRWVKGDTRPTRRRREVIAVLLSHSVAELFDHDD